MSRYLTGADLEAMQLPEDDVAITSGLVRVRGLAHGEVVDLSDTPGEYIDKIVSLGLIDPKLTVEQVAAWRKRAGAYDIIRIHTRIEQLSGRDAGAVDRAYKSDREEPDASMGTVPPGEVGVSDADAVA